MKKTLTINTDNYDAVTITALAEAITSFTTNLSGIPTNFQKLIIRIKDNGTAMAITWGDSFQIDRDLAIFCDGEPNYYQVELYKRETNQDQT